MKKYFLLLLLPLCALFSCLDNNDGYSLDKYWVDLATVDNPDKGSAFYLNLDDGDRLWLAATNFYNYKPKTGQRIVAYYTLLSDKPEGSPYDHDAKLVDVYEVLTKKVFDIKPATQDSVGNDPIIANKLWIAQDHLNIEFSYRGDNKIHFINLVKDPLQTYPDGKVHLEFRHNAYNDATSYERKGLVSFDLSPLKPNPAQNTTKFIELVIHVKDYDGKDNKHEMKYEFGTKSDKIKDIDPRLYSDTKLK